MRNNHLKIIPLLFFIIFLLLLQVIPIHASYSTNPSFQEPIPPGIDLIILLDQSGSMKGVAGPATDPENRRVYTTQYLIDYMSFDNRFVNPDRTNRVLVIGFGSPDKAEILVPLTTLEDGQAVEDAKKKVTAKDLGDTDFVSPLKLIREVFPLATDEEVKNGTRQRIVVVITDGGPWDDRGLTHLQYFNEIKDYYINKLDLAKHFPLYIVGIDDADRYWPRIGPLWQTFTAAAEKVKDVNEINEYVAGKLCSLLNPAGSGSECRLQELGLHFIQPYASSAAFSFFKYSPNAKIMLRRPGEKDPQQVKQGDSDLLDYQSNPRDEFYVLSNPKAGCWESQRQGEGKVDVVTQVVFNRLRLAEPKGMHSLTLPLRMVFELRDENGGLIGEDPNYPVTIEATLTAPDGSTQSIQIDRLIENGNPVAGKYISTNVPDIKQIGRYSLELVGYTAVNDPQATRCLSEVGPIKVFQNSYEIPVGTPEFQVVSPDETWLQYSPLEGLKVGFTDEKGNALYMPEGVPWTFEMTAKSPSGEQFILPTPALTDGLYVINDPLIFDESGTYELQGTLKDKAGKLIYNGVANLTTGVNIKATSPGNNFPTKAELKEVLVNLQDLNGQPALPDPQYPLRMEAELFPPNGQEAVGLVALEATDNPGEYRGLVDWTIAEEGVYTLQVRGFLTVPPGGEQLAFDHPVTVGSTGSMPYYIVVTPQQEKNSSENVFALHLGLLPLIKPMPFRVDVLRNGQPVPPGEVFKGDLDELVVMNVLDANGKPLVSGREMQVSKNGQYLESSANELKEEGAYSATFSFSGDVIGGLSAEGAWPDVRVDFMRQDSDWVLWTWRVILALVVVLAVGVLAWYLLEFQILTKAKGKLVAEIAAGTNRGEEIGDFPVNRKKRHTVTYKQKQSPMGRLKLNKLVITPADDPLKSFDWRIYLAVALLSILLTVVIAVFIKTIEWNWVWALLGISLIIWAVALLLLRRVSRGRQARERDPRGQRHEQRLGVQIEADSKDRKGVAKGSLYTSGGNRYLNVNQKDANDQTYQFKVEEK